MQRRQPLSRRTPLRPDPEKVAAWVRSSRQPLARIGAKARREQSALRAAQRAVRTRAGGRCEAAGLVDPGNAARYVCDDSGPHDGAHVHHVWPEDRDAGRHDPDRLLLLCVRAHTWAHLHPDRAARLGLLRPERNPAP